MKVPSTYTFILSRNFGQPVTIQLAAWRVYTGLALGGLLLGGMMLFTMLFFFQYPRLKHLEQKVDTLQKDQAELRQQLLSRDMRYFHGKEMLAARMFRNPGHVQESTVQLAALGQTEAEDYQLPVAINNISARVDGLNVWVSCKLAAQGKSGSQGGYLFFILERQDGDFPVFLSTSRGEINERGFPEHYKTGTPFYLMRRIQTFEGRVKRKTGTEYFTHLSVYLFSIRGALLAKDRIELDPSMFVPGMSRSHNIQET
ncbi:MAG: hypothetical protein OEW12_09235 [Deltaproteobacteria bacterium]|nr:hypothetical protein [Deltaproteobacteria bacterium]